MAAAACSSAWTPATTSARRSPLVPQSVGCCSVGPLRWNFGRLKLCLEQRGRGSRLGTVTCAMAGAGDASGPAPIFPRINIKDPYKRLGISNEASEEELREARNYLLKLYGDDEKSRASIESAYDKIIFDSLKKWKKRPKPLKPPPVWLQKTYERFEVPPMIDMATRAVPFLVLGIWSVLDSAAGGPSFQVILSLAACIYFLKKRFKVLWKASAIGVASFILAWIFGSLLIPILPPVIFPGSWNIELMTSLISYVVLWMSSTFLK